MKINKLNQLVMKIIFSIAFLPLWPMTRKLSELLRTCFKLELNFITENEEIELIKEISRKLRFMRWNKGHFDGKISNYREYMTQELRQFPTLDHLMQTRINDRMLGKDLLPVHILELNHDGEILPHVDNINYSGSVIAGLSLQRDSILTLSNTSESESIELPRRSFYRQM